MAIIGSAIGIALGTYLSNRYDIPARFMALLDKAEG